jgi:hypothetical protein
VPVASVPVPLAVAPAAVDQGPRLPSEVSLQWKKAAAV